MNLRVERNRLGHVLGIARCSAWSRMMRFTRGAAWLWLTLVVAFAREERRLDTGWVFHLGDVAGAEQPAFEARGWAAVELPHDWSIGLPVDSSAPAGGNGGFFQNGIGWYRHTFSAPVEWAGQRVSIEFEGVYRRAEVWLNGTRLGAHAYGYTPFSFDLTAHLRIGAPNVLAVRVDNAAQPSSRWYSGSGIYRHVWLRVTNPVHIVEGGVFAATTALSESNAIVRVETTVRNESDSPRDVAVETTLVDPSGAIAATTFTPMEIAAGGEAVITPTLSVARPQLWSPETPRLYAVQTRVRRSSTVSGQATPTAPTAAANATDRGALDEITTPFGLRTIRVSAERGFELNGRTLKLNGGNVHHDNGLLGAAAFDRAEERKAELLHGAGFNAVRTAHNPPSSAFLAACDRLGLLVIDEAFDGWEKKKTAHDYGEDFAAWSERDVAAMVRRDRNHPAVVLWSVGNEVYERGSASGARIAQALTRTIRALDPSRPITAGINGMGKNGDWTKTDPVFATLDVAGYNYEIARHAADHARLPGRAILAAESYQSEVFANWAIVHDTPYVIGDVVWSALDYLGEAGIGRVFPPGEPVVKHWEGSQWPWHGAACGDIDLTGARKPISHYRAIVWERGEMLYAAVRVPPPPAARVAPAAVATDTKAKSDDRAAVSLDNWNVSPWTVMPTRASWTWPGNEGRALTLEVYSRHEAVRVYLNGRLLGERPVGRPTEFKAEFAVPYAPGELKVVGVTGGREREATTLRTAGAATQLRVAVDRPRLRADGQDLAFVTIEALDANGVLVPQDTAAVQVAIDGPATLAAVGNADLASLQTYQDNPHALFEGRALAVVRTTRAAGKLRVTVTSPGLRAGELTLETWR